MRLTVEQARNLFYQWTIDGKYNEAEAREALRVSDIIGKLIANVVTAPIKVVLTAGQVAACVGDVICGEENAVRRQTMKLRVTKDVTQDILSESGMSYIVQIIIPAGTIIEVEEVTDDTNT